MTDLSPAAFAVWDAAWDCRIGHCRTVEESRRHQIAAALRALAVRINGADDIRQDILDIADELERAS